MSIFDVLTKANMTTEERPMSDLKCVKRSYKHIAICDIAYEKSEHNITYVFTIAKKITH